jgi:hypothetical protein
MDKIIKKIGLRFVLLYESIKYFIGIVLYRAQIDVFGDNADLSEKNKKNIRMRHRIQFLNDFENGKENHMYSQKYYEILKGADKFMKNATPEKMAIAADRHGMNYGQKDKFGRTYEHYGFYDEKHKHAGKTLAEVIALDYEERRTKDDNYKMITIFNNKPIEAGLSEVFKSDVKKTNNKDYEYEVIKPLEQSKQFIFPIKVYRDVDVLNKIEQLTQFLHLKKITEEVLQFEFFIPLKFKTNEIKEDSDIFKELTTMKHIAITDEYGVVRRFGNLEFKKRLTHDEFDVIKFTGVESEYLGIY